MSITNLSRNISGGVTDIANHNTMRFSSAKNSVRYCFSVSYNTTVYEYTAAVKTETS